MAAITVSEKGYCWIRIHDGEIQCVLGVGRHSPCSMVNTSFTNNSRNNPSIQKPLAVLTTTPHNRNDL
jgi:hypothetical protein